MSGECLNSTTTWRPGFLHAVAEWFAHAKRCDVCVYDGTSSCEGGRDLEAAVVELRGDRA